MLHLSLGGHKRNTTLNLSPSNGQPSPSLLEEALRGAARLDCQQVQKAGQNKVVCLLLGVSELAVPVEMPRLF